jgi:multidrug efflux pump subunit AcrA (membrane-fusion protein)
LGEGENQPRLAVSKNALVTRKGRTVAFVLKGNQVKETQVATGPALGELVEILGGLKEGDRVVVTPPSSLDDGDRVKLKES